MDGRGYEKGKGEMGHEEKEERCLKTKGLMGSMMRKLWIRRKNRLVGMSES